MSHSGTADSVRARRRRIGSLLRAARKAAGVTQVEVKGVLACSQSTVTKIENGTTTISAENLGELIDFLDVDQVTAAELRRLNEVNSVSRLRPGRRRAGPAWFGDVPELELRASEIRSWTGERIPGVLQSEQYMLAQFQAAGCANVPDLIAARKDRQRIFDREGRREFLLSESALDRLCATATPLMALDEVQHLLKTGELAGVRIRIVPYGRGLYLEPDFTILGFPDEPDQVYVEYVSGKLLLHKKNDVTEHQRAWAALDGRAATAAESARFLVALRDRLDASLFGKAAR
ncbi:Scr1 family TA system antitoxin-like transcriptional regulator [Amycolatopsis sp. 195334CR]|uniref:helix-turn-helix domain-containing protein n=1 Tax=Amycolatopsis sp. 195334CR TaxID=2814588 RepID=UPI001A8FCACA|nr:Scr1 family TA system antitoxin-like transcriptional regulator [Amycolatopsis sp. 195334CR]MBN6036859.1 helix-turn-helix transcriptional regulator [Amycolatopsis sp. 195334CR]